MFAVIMDGNKELIKGLPRKKSNKFIIKNLLSNVIFKTKTVGFYK